MTTAQDLITGALQLLGVYDPGQALTAADAALGLEVMGDMFDSWSNESLTCYAWLTSQITLVANQQSYPVGPGSSFNTVRPIRILEDPGTCFIRDSNQNDYPIQVLPQDMWNLIGLKTNTSDIPDTLFYDPQFPQGIINIFPIPTIAYTLFYSSYLQLVDPSVLTSSVSLPPGYNKMIKFNLAIDLKPYFDDANLDPVVIAQAAESKANVKRSNMKVVEAVYDNEIVSRASPTYNIYRDRQNGT